MNDFKRFVRVLTKRLKSNPPFIECSRVELMTNEMTQSVMVLIRTKPSLSAKIMTSPEFHYPGVCLINTMKVVASIIEYINKRIVLLAANELVQAAMGDAMSLLKMNEETSIFAVPRIQHDGNALTAEWEKILLASPHPWIGQTDMTGIGLHVVHLPDVSLRREELFHLATFSVGWNFAHIFGKGYVKEMTRIIEYASHNARTILIC